MIQTGMAYHGEGPNPDTNLTPHPDSAMTLGFGFGGKGLSAMRGAFYSETIYSRDRTGVT